MLGGYRHEVVAYASDRMWYSLLVEHMLMPVTVE
jgi:hypothetical protein